ncbi:MAG: hypothetical protein CVU11_14015 [Bacteroidetes bacterium HGW-Bacteroidetes-6]|jgi:hypothetical protein|nr:MAG: hypothetical protein CVU11_14015 [Bacteroidetes bacterium HGW-Bacteroidetes-6]
MELKTNLSPLQRQINAALKKFNADTEQPYKAIVEERNEAYAKYKALEQEINEKFNGIKREAERPLVKLIEQYYDKTLLDSKKKPVKVGSIIIHGTKFFKVTSRYMTTKKGVFQFDPRVVVERVNGSKGSKMEILPVELKYYTVSTVGIKIETIGEGGQA